MKKISISFFAVSALFLMGINIGNAQAASVTFGSSSKLFAPNCYCKEDVSKYNLAPWCGVRDTCNGETGTQTMNVASGDYKVKVNLGSLTDYQRYEEIIVTINGVNYSISDQGGNGSSTGTAQYNLGTIHLSGNVSFKATHKYANIFTGLWYSDEISRIGGVMESIDINSIVLEEVTPPPVIPKPTCAINASPASINSGDATTLSWSSTNASSLSINQNIGNVSLNGSKSVTPSQNTTYTATATGSGGTVTCNANVIVNVLSPSINIVKNDNDNGDDNQSIDKNGTANFKITVTNTGNANLTNIIINDQEAPSCNMSASQTKSLYGGNYLAPGASFAYTCADPSVSTSYVNTAAVTASTENGSQNVNDNDGSNVTVNNIPPVPTPEPEPTPEPKQEEDDCKGTIGNYIWLDANSDGVQDKGEKGLAGISVKLKKDNGKTVDKETTNGKGEYEFDDLCKGKYTVYVDDEDVASYIQTYDPDGNKNNKTDVTLKSDKDTHTKADFGYNKTRVAPATGPGLISLYVAAIVSIIALLYHKKFRKTELSFEEQLKKYRR